MAYDQQLADRIRHILREKNADFTDRAMMGGIMFKVDEKMLCGTHIDKKYGDSLLMVRVGTEAYPDLLQRPEALPMTFTGRSMKGYLFVQPEGFASNAQLAEWLQHCLDFNPFAKKSAKKKKK